MTKKISAVVLVGGKIDKDLLKTCLDSISWCDEIVKIETEGLSGSFASWRNEGAKRAQGEWLLYIDTDEQVTSELEKVIQQVVGSNEFAGYAIPRRNIIFGKEMKHCGLWPDFVLRLIKKDKLKGWYGELHEQPIIDGEISHLKEPFVHIKHKNLSDMVDKTNEWSEIEAKLMYDANHPKMNIIRFFTAAFREFWYRAIRKYGFLDGPVGIIEIIYQVFSRFVSYAKLWEMQLQSKRVKE